MTEKTETPRNKDGTIQFTGKNGIVQYPDTRLQEVSSPVKVIDEDIMRIADEMLNTTSLMKRTCAGLSAIQIGYPLRIIMIVDYPFARDFASPVILINPVIVKHSSQTFPSSEGCLSVYEGSNTYTVNRYKIVKVEAIDLKGNRVVYKERGFLASVLQHEIDHLDGRLINDKQN